MFSWQCVSLIKINFFVHFPRKIEERNNLTRSSLLSQLLFLLVPSLLTDSAWPPDKTTRLDPLLHEANLSTWELELSPCCSFSLLNSPFSCFFHLALLTHHFYQHSNMLAIENASKPHGAPASPTTSCSSLVKCLLPTPPSLLLLSHFKSHKSTVGMRELGLQPF